MTSSLFGDDDIPEELSLDEKIAEIEGAEPEDVTPRSNPDLFGHEEAEARLLADFNAGRMPHALILAGPAGIGKATLAYRLAKFLLSRKEEAAGLFGAPEKPSTLATGAQDPVFRRVVSSGHADLLTVEREFDEKKNRMKTDISVESVRRIAPFLRKTAAEGGWRVVIVDGAECLNASSQNALLKILEEPPSKTVLILTTTQPGAFLPTIRSRCRMVMMEPLADNTVAKLLDRLAPGSTDRAALVRLAEGSAGRALQYAKDGGVALYKDLLKAAATLPDLDAVLVHDIAEKIGRQGAEASFDVAREIMTGWCARQVRAAARGAAPADTLNGDAEIFARIAAQYPPRHFFDVWEKMSRLFHETETYNLDKRQAVLNAFLMLQKPEHQGLNA